jgi:hypothetical protein
VDSSITVRLHLPPFLWSQTFCKVSVLKGSVYFFLVPTRSITLIILESWIVLWILWLFGVNWYSFIVHLFVYHSTVQFIAKVIQSVHHISRSQPLAPVDLSSPNYFPNFLDWIFTGLPFESVRGAFQSALTSSRFIRSSD